MSVLEHTIAALLSSDTATGRYLKVSGDRIVACDDLSKVSDGHVTEIPKAASDEATSVVFCRGLPWLSESCSRRWVGDRLFCFPDGVPGRRRISIVSSRLRERLDLESWWFDLLRTLVLRLQPDNDALVVADHTTPCHPATRSAVLFGRSVIRFVVNNSTTNAGGRQASRHHPRELREWITSSLQRPALRPPENTELTECRVLVSPEIDSTASLGSSDTVGRCSEVFPAPPSALPLADRLLFAAAEEVYVFSARSNGNIASLLRLHSEDAERQAAPLLVAGNSDGELPPAVRELNGGWIPWLLQPCSSPKINDEISDGLFDKPAHPHSPEWSLSNDSSSPLIDPENWVQHWTRPAPQRWPGETLEDFFDAHILRTAAANRSALATLLRIVSTGKIIASSEGIRDAHRVVAFTHVPLSQFRRRRLFRKHRRRFDFEPWGIAVQRTTLESLGLRPVVYGNDPEWNLLSAADRPFFQKASQGSSGSDYDECEWRIPGDLDLRQLPATSVVVFVDSEEAAQIVRRQCHWAVVVVPDDAPGPGPEAFEGV